MLAGFVREAHSYLPQIREGIETFQHDAPQREVLEEALRYTHTIKGASAMVGLPVLSHMAKRRRDIGRGGHRTARYGYGVQYLATTDDGSA